MNQVKLAIPSHYEPLQLEKIGKVVNQVKLAVPNHSKPLWWEKIGKVVNQSKLVGKDWKRCKSGKIGHSESL